MSNPVEAAALGPEPGKFCATAVRRVLELAFDKGHADPRDKNHWWPWQEWPFDGRQWDYAENSSYKLNRSCVSEHKERAKMEGCLGSKLRVERKLEGMIWDNDKPRTELRASGAFHADIFPTVDDLEAEDVDDPSLLHLNLLNAAIGSKERPLWDSSVLPHPLLSNAAENVISEETNLQFQMQRPFDRFIQSYCAPDHYHVELLTFRVFKCTAALATRDEQKKILNKEIEDEDGCLSVSVEASIAYVDPEDDSEQVVFVVAEVPVTALKEALYDRVAGFVLFRDNRTLMDKLPIIHIPDSVVDDSDSKSAIRLIYVEACDCDYEALSDSQKDAILEDRALILHRLVQSIAKPEADAVLQPLTVSTPTYESKQAHGFPPIRALRNYQTIRNPDPRWPLVRPNSVCLECGKGPKHTDEEMRVDKLLTCSKCRERNFCSNECLTRSWKSKVWPHKYECKRAHALDQEQVGVSSRQQFHEILRTQEGVNPDAERILESLFDDFDQVAGSIDELHEQREEKKKAQKAARRAKKKGKKRK